MPLLICPQCRQPFAREKSAALPFCSQRCRLIDLGRWLGEEHALPVVRDEDEEPEDISSQDDEPQRYRLRGEEEDGGE